MTDKEIDDLAKKIEESRPAGKCWFGHKWSRWSDMYIGKSRRWNGYNYEYDSVPKQKKICLKCYLMKERII